MAKKNITLQFTNAELSIEDGEYILTETTKDDTKVYSLSKYLNSLIGQEVSLNLRNTQEIDSIE